MRYLKYLLFIVLNSFVLNTYASPVNNVIVEGSINGTDVFASGYSENGNFSTYKQLSSGTEPRINLYVQDSALASANYLVVMTYCTTTTNFINVVTPNSPDIVNAKLTGNYGTNNNLGLCSIAGFNGALFQGVFGVSKLPNNESFELRIWGGMSYTYNTFVQIVDVSLYNDTPETRNSFINNINTNKMIDNQNQIKNKLNDMQNSLNDVKGSINDVNSSINNDSVDDPSSSINQFKDKIAENGVITQLVGLPVTLFTKILNSVNGTCSPYNFGSLFGTDIVFPCINVSNYLGSTLWNIIDVLISGLFVYSLSRKFIKVFEHMSSMNEGDVIGD